MEETNRGRGGPSIATTDSLGGPLTAGDCLRLDRPAS